MRMHAYGIPKLVMHSHLGRYNHMSYVYYISIRSASIVSEI
jgi:hypothetical protein